MKNTPPDEPTVEELVTKALQANVIDQEFAGDLRSSADLEEALGMFYTYIFEKGGNPETLLIEWGIIELENATEVEEADNRLLREGTNVSYAELTGELRKGEVLVAAWRGSPISPKVQRIVDENDFASIVSEIRSNFTSPAIKSLHLVDSFRVGVRWFASTTGSENPIDYDMFD